MGRPCVTCTHPKRYEIEKGLVEGIPYRILTEKYGPSSASLSRHRNEHLPAHLAKAHQSEQAKRLTKLEDRHAARVEGNTHQALDVVQQLRAINSACLEVLQKSRDDGKHSLSLQAVDRIHRQLELQAKLLGELQETGPQVNVLVAPEWREIKVTILAALSPFPEARSAISKVLQDARP
jgi:hypothetical protein